MISDFRKKIKYLQIQQIKHDLDAHRDLYHALLPKKITHYTLHFAKYQGQLIEALQSDSKKSFCKGVVDSAIILLACANSMNMDLDITLEKKDVSNDSSSYEIIKKYVVTVSKMAKACEVLDHLEGYQSRTVLEGCICDLFFLIDSLSYSKNINLVQEISDRWKDIESKNFASLNVFSKGEL